MSRNGEDLAIPNALAEHYNRIHQKDKRPNVLILMTDQQRYDTICALGNSHMVTPNMDRLVREGCSYINAYTPNPICCPARHSFLTGVSTGLHGIADNDYNARLDPRMITFPRLFSQAGYITEAIGKMHFQPCREHHGFARLQLMEEVPEHIEDDDYALYLRSKGYGHILNIHGVRNLLFYAPQQALIPEEHHGTTWVGDRGIEFINNNGGKRPFLLYMSFIAPHPPFNSYSQYTDLYKEQDIPMPVTTKTPLCSMAEENKAFGDLPTDDYIKRMRQCYYSMISQIDHQVGRVIQALEDNNILEETMIILTSDHGDLLGDYGLYQKFLPYDSSSRIPIIVRYPLLFPKGSKEETFTDLTDICPTILELAGIEHPVKDSLIGESLIARHKEKDREHQYVSYSVDNRRWASVRNKQYKYNYYYGGGREELFDLLGDPKEQRNLLYCNTDLLIKEIARNLRMKLVEYEKKYWKDGYVSGDDFRRLSEYKPVVTRNSAFPQFHRLLKDQSNLSQYDFIGELKSAITDEPVVKISELDLQPWIEHGGFSDAEIKRLFEEEICHDQ